jgi:UDP-N-acetylmuramyl pentapeptide phosphotransferase/UDP-N-acetylglucosamine-1-phosphate transferase
MAVLGIDDPYIWGGYLVAIVLAIICAVYGFLNWNKEKEKVEGAEDNG